MVYPLSAVPFLRAKDSAQPMLSLRRLRSGFRPTAWNWAAPLPHYVEKLLGLRPMRAWYADALQEKFRDVPHEEEIALIGEADRGPARWQLTAR